MPPFEPVPLADRLWPKIDAAGDCWEWTAYRNKDGYGLIGIAGRMLRAHRVVWEVLVGPIPDEMQLDHRCRNTGCVNPDHLEVVTGRVNILRGFGPAGRNARRDQCAAGHDLTDPANLYRNRARPTSRDCRLCTLSKRRDDPAIRDEINARQREWWAANRDEINARRRARKEATG
jgi:hypothetical protein